MAVIMDIKASLEPQETWVLSLGQEDPLEDSLKSHGCRSLVGYSPEGCKESDTTEAA